jgi:hypothetical protein
MSEERNDELTPEDLAAAEKEVQPHRDLLAWVLSQGLGRDKTQPNNFVHPNDPDLSAWRDPHTQEMLLSPKMAEMLAEQIKRDLYDQ